jgi:hypothetical protein
LFWQRIIHILIQNNLKKVIFAKKKEKRKKKKEKRRKKEFLAKPSQPNPCEGMNHSTSNE